MSDALFDVSGRTILVTGGARGIGLDIAKGLAEREALVVLADRSGDVVAKAVQELPGKGHAFCQLDVTNEQSVDAAIAMSRSITGSLDGVVNSAGIAKFGPAVEMPADDFVDVMTVNLVGAFLVSRCAARVMLKQEGGGRIVQMASAASQVVNERYAAYSASKAALSHMVRILAMEWSKSGICVNAIGPALTRTPLAEATLLADPNTAAYGLSKIPMGRLGTTMDLLGSVLLLLSPAGSFITGQTIYVDGGRTLQ